MVPTTGQIDWGFLGYTPTPATGSPYDYSNSSFDLSPQRTNEIMANVDADGFGNSDWFGKNGYLPTAFMGLQALGGLANAYTGLQQLALGRKQFGFAKDAFNAQLGNSIQNYRNAAANARRVAFAAQGANAPSVFGTTSQDAAGNQYANDVSKNMVTKV